jgi:hypothetical protein
MNELVIAWYAKFTMRGLAAAAWAGDAKSIKQQMSVRITATAERFFIFSPPFVK